MNDLDLHGRKFDDKEYECLRQELGSRLEMIHSHGFTLISIVLVFFSAMFVLVGGLLKLAVESKAVLGYNIITDSLICIAVVVLCAFPIPLVYCFSGKYEDNLRQIVSISEYQKVFFEYPTLICDAKKTDVAAWELLHCNGSVPKAKIITGEYLAISIADLLVCVIAGIALLAFSYSSKGYLTGNNGGNIATAIIAAVFFAAIICGLIYLTAKTRRNTDTLKIMGKYSKYYFEEYLNLAVKYNFYTKQQAQELEQIIADFKNRDDELSKKLRRKAGFNKNKTKDNSIDNRNENKGKKK